MGLTILTHRNFLQTCAMAVLGCQRVDRVAWLMAQIFTFVHAAQWHQRSRSQQPSHNLKVDMCIATCSDSENISSWRECDPPCDPWGFMASQAGRAAKWWAAAVGVCKVRWLVVTKVLSWNMCKNDKYIQISNIHKRTKNHRISNKCPSKTGWWYRNCTGPSDQAGANGSGVAGLDTEPVQEWQRGSVSLNDDRTSFDKHGKTMNNSLRGDLLRDYCIHYIDHTAIIRVQHYHILSLISYYTDL